MSEIKGYDAAAYRYDNLTPEDFMDPAVERRSRWIDHIQGEDTEIENALTEQSHDRDIAKAVAFFYLNGLEAEGSAQMLRLLWRGVDRVIQEYVDDEIRKAVMY